MASWESRLLAWARKNGLDGSQARRLLRRERKEMVGAREIFDKATSFMPCCGRWFAVVTLPQVTPCCGKTHLVALKRATLDAHGIDYRSAKEPWRGPRHV
jgi:hypothetical protein